MTLATPAALITVTVFVIAVGVLYAVNRNIDAKRQHENRVKNIEGIGDKLKLSTSEKIKTLDDFKVLAKEVEAAEQRLAALRLDLKMQRVLLNMI